MNKTKDGQQVAKEDKTAQNVLVETNVDKKAGIVKNENSNKQGTKENAQSNISKPVIVAGNKGTLQNSGQDSKRPKSIVSQSLPSNIKDFLTLEQKRSNRPQADGQVSKSQTLQKNVKESQHIVQKPGNQLNNAKKSPTVRQKPSNQPNNLQKLQADGQKPVNQPNNVQKSLPNGQKPGNQPNNTQKQQSGGQKPGNQPNNTQKLHSDGQKPGMQPNNTQKLESGGQKPGNQPNNAQKLQAGGQKPGNQPNNLQKSQLNGQKPSNQPNNTQKFESVVKKNDNQPINSQKSQPRGQKPTNQPKNQQKSQPGGQKSANQPNNAQKSQQVGQKPTNQPNNAQKSQPGGQKPTNQPNNQQKSQPSGQKPTNQLNNQQKSQPDGKQLNNLSNNLQKSQQGIQKPGSRADNLQKSQQTVQKPGSQGINLQKSHNQTAQKQGQKDQNGRQTRNQPSRSSQNPANTGKGPGDKKKKRKKQEERKVNLNRPQIVEYPAGITSIHLTEAHFLLKEIERLKDEPKYKALAEFLSKLLQKVQNLETGNYSRTEVELFVRQFQDYNEGFHYRTDSKPRGYALILTNTVFYKVPGDPWSYALVDRPGAEIDADNFEQLLTEMGYLVTRRDNLKHWEMAWELKCMAEQDHKKFDSFMCIISSHGNLNQIFGCDGLKMTLSKEIRQFQSEKCPTLAGKPKLFFLQSCQEDDDEPYFRSESTVPGEGSNNKPKSGELERSRFLINDVDFLVGYSTLPGNLSYRHEQTGSWYLNALYQNLKENFTKYDIISILEDVNYDVDSKKSQYNYLESNQVSMFSSTLRGPLCFQ